MKLSAYYSHLNGFEWLDYHHPEIWKELTDAISAVDASKYKKKSKEKTMAGKEIYAPVEINKAFRNELYARDWESPKRNQFYCSADPEITKQLLNLSYLEQRELLQSLGMPLVPSYNEADFVKDNVSLEVQFGKYFSVQFDLFIKHAANYMQNRIDLGIEIVPMKSMEQEMSSGPPYYEKHLHEILRQGRIFPPVPLILIGIEP